MMEMYYVTISQNPTLMKRNNLRPLAPFANMDK